MAASVVEVKVADTEAVRSLIDDVAAAAREFGHLGDGEIEALPEPVQAGIRALRRACERASGTIPPARTPDGEPVHAGYVGIEWPAPVLTAPAEGQTYPRAMVAWKITIWDAMTGEPINTARKVVLRASCDHWVTADLTMLADRDGKPVLGGSTIYADDDGNVLEGVFSFLVAEMRTTPAALEGWTPEQVAEFQQRWAELNGKREVRWLAPGNGELDHQEEATVGG